jgi:ubiquinone/menaquinone biosynthesis C-methylase UbiE
MKARFFCSTPAILVVPVFLLLAQSQPEKERLAEVLDLKAAMNVAEIGAGDGEMSFFAAGKVGRIYVNEIDSRKLGKLRDRAANVANVTVVEGDAINTLLPEGCCDAVFMRDVYHHLTDAAAINASIARALRPGGVFMVIDFLPGNEGHGITPEKLVESVTRAGFEPIRTIDDWALRSYCVLFRKSKDCD